MLFRMATDHKYRSEVLEEFSLNDKMSQISRLRNHGSMFTMFMLHHEASSEAANVCEDSGNGRGELSETLQAVKHDFYVA